MLCVAVMLSVMVLGAGAAFSDQDQIENTEAVEMATALKIIDGYEDGSFHPERNIKRSEMCKMICIALNGGKVPATSTKDDPTFSDIGGHWAEGYIEYCYAQGVVSGVGGGRFNPDGNVTVTQAAKMLLVALGYNADVEQFNGANWSLYVNVKANQDGIYEDLEAIDTAAALTRDQAAQMIWNTMQAVIIMKTNSIDVTTGEVTSHYNKHELGRTLLEEKYNGDIGVGFMIGYTYDAAKGLWSYTFNGSDYHGASISDNDRLTSQIELRTATDYTALFGQQVKVVYKVNNADVVYGVYANDSAVVKTGFSGDVTATNVPASNATEIKIGDVTYKLDSRADATNVIYYQTGGVVDTLNDMDDINGHYTYQMVDNNGNGKIDLVIITPFTFGKVTYVGNDTVTVSLQNGDTDTGVSGNRELADVAAYDGIAKDDYVMCINSAYAVKEVPTYVKQEIVSGTITGVKGTQYKIGDAWYTNLTGTTLNSGDTIDYIALGSELYYAKVTSGSFGVDAVAVVYGLADTANSGVAGAYAEIGVMNAKGEKIVGELVEVNGTKITDTLSGTPSITGVSDAQGTNGASVTLANLTGDLVKYEVDSDGGVHVWTIRAGYAAPTGTQTMGFDGTLATGATFDNTTDKVGGASGKELADNAVVFVYNTTDQAAKVYTGKELKNIVGSSFGIAGTDYGSGLYGKVNGFSYAQVVVLQSASWPTINTGASYGYLVEGAYTAKEEGVNYRYYSYWDGTQVVHAKEKDKSDLTGFVAGSVITFDDNGDGTIKNVSLPTMGLGAVTGWDADAGRISINTDTSGNSKVTSDTVVLYVDSKNTKGVAGGEISEAVNLDSSPDGSLEDNVMYLAGGNDTYALIVVDVNHLVQNAPVVNLTYTNVAALQTALATSNININSDVALNAALTVPTGRTLTITGNVTGSSNITLSGTASLNVGGNITNTGTITVNSGSLNVTGNVAGAITSAGTVMIGGTSVGITATAGTVEVTGNTTGSVNLSGSTVGKFKQIDGNLTLDGNGEFTAESIDWTDAIDVTDYAGTATLTGTTGIATNAATTLGGKWTINAKVTLATGKALTVAANSSVDFKGGITFTNENTLLSTNTTSKFSVGNVSTTVATGDTKIQKADDSTSLADKDIAGASFTGSATTGEWKADADLSGWNS